MRNMLHHGELMELLAIPLGARTTVAKWLVNSEREDLLWDCAMLGGQLQGEPNFGNNRLFFFAIFVPFMVKTGNIG